MAKSKKIDHARQMEGYNKIFKSFKEANSIPALTRAVQRSIPILTEYKLDESQQKKLEDYGFDCYEKLQKELRNIDSELKSNNFKENTLHR